MHPAKLQLNQKYEVLPQVLDWCCCIDLFSLSDNQQHFDNHSWWYFLFLTVTFKWFNKMIWEINTIPSYWTNVLTSQDSLQNLQDWLGCGSMEGKPATTVKLHEGEGVSQHLAEHWHLTWSPRKQDNSPGLEERTEERFLKTEKSETSRTHWSWDSVLCFFNSFSSSTFSFSTTTSLSHLVYLSPSLCRSARLLMPGSPHIQLLAVWLSEESQQTETALCNDEGISRAMSNLPCSIAAKTLRFSSVAAAKLTVRSRGGTGQSAGFDQINEICFGGGWSFQCGFCTLLQISKRRLGRSLEYWAGWCSHWAPLHHILHKYSSLCREETHDSS